MYLNYINYYDSIRIHTVIITPKCHLSSLLVYLYLLIAIMIITYLWLYLFPIALYNYTFISYRVLGSFHFLCLLPVLSVLSGIIYTFLEKNIQLDQWIGVSSSNYSSSFPFNSSASRYCYVYLSIYLLSVIVELVLLHIILINWYLHRSSSCIIGFSPILFGLHVGINTLYK